MSKRAEKGGYSLQEGILLKDYREMTIKYIITNTKCNIQNSQYKNQIGREENKEQDIKRKVY